MEIEGVGIEGEETVFSSIRVTESVVIEGGGIEGIEGAFCSIWFGVSVETESAGVTEVETADGVGIEGTEVVVSSAGLRIEGVGKTVWFILGRGSTVLLTGSVVPFVRGLSNLAIGFVEMVFLRLVFVLS